MNKLILAVQKSGKLHDGTMDLLLKCGIKPSKARNEFLATSLDFPTNLYLIRDDDIPEFVNKGICDCGIVGMNVLEEFRLENGAENIEVVQNLKFSRCRLSLAVPEKEANYKGVGYFEGKKIATSYPKILAKFMSENGVKGVKIIRMQGSVELSTQIGIADGICDIVSSGSTLAANRLKEVDNILKSEAVLIINKDIADSKKALLDSLKTRINGVNAAKISKYIMMHAPKDRLDEVIKIIPGCEKPTVLGLHEDAQRVALHAVSAEEIFWTKLEELKAIGCSSILVLPIEKMID
jgi:ATP phosphoribosyltransferase